MAQAALLADQIPRQLSFKHTVQIWMAWQQRGGGAHDAVCINALLVMIAEPRVGLRPGRGKCQGSCRIDHASFASDWLFREIGFPGLSNTEEGAFQSRVEPDQRAGLAALAAW